MFLLNPLILGLSAVVSIPVALHFLNRRKRKTLIIPTAILLVERDREDHFIRFQNVRDKLVLLTRILMILALVAAFVGLMMRRGALFSVDSDSIPGGRDENLVFLVDTSGSMAYEAEGANSIGRAAALIKNIIRERNPKTLSLYGFDQRLREFIPCAEAGYQLSERLSLLKPTLMKANLPTATRALSKRLKELETNNARVVVLSDMQPNVLGDQTSLQSFLKPNFASLSMVNSGPKRPGNCRIDEWNLTRSGDTLTIDFNVENCGQAPQTWRARLYPSTPNAKCLKQWTGALEPGEKQHCLTTFDFNDSHWAGRVVIDGDYFTPDNVVHVAYDAPEPPTVMVIDAPRDKNGGPAPLLAALKAADEERGLDIIECDDEGLKDIPSRQPELMVLGSLAYLNDDHVQAYLNKGGRAVVYVDGESKASTIAGIHFGKKIKFDAPPFMLPGPAHGPFREAYWFRSPKRRAAPTRSAREISGAPEESTYAVFDPSGVPAIFSYPCGAGNVVAFNFECPRNKGADAYNVMFAMTLQRIVDDVLGDEKPNASVNVSVGELVRFSWGVKGEMVRLIDAKGKKLAESISNEEGVVSFPSFAETGSFQARGTISDQQRSVTVNTIPSESVFREASPVPSVENARPADMTKNGNSSPFHTRVTLPFLLAALLLAFFELLIGRK